MSKSALDDMGQFVTQYNPIKGVLSF